MIYSWELMSEKHLVLTLQFNHELHRAYPSSSNYFELRSQSSLDVIVLWSERSAVHQKTLDALLLKRSTHGIKLP